MKIKYYIITNAANNTINDKKRKKNLNNEQIQFIIKKIK